MAAALRRVFDRIRNWRRRSPPPAGVREPRRPKPSLPAAAVALEDDRRYDLVVATNILVYYDAFEQSLALANIAKMLKPGGWFLTNYAVSPLPPMEPAASQTTTVYFDKQRNGDTIYAYQRRK